MTAPIRRLATVAGLVLVAGVLVVVQRSGGPATPAPAPSATASVAAETRDEQYARVAEAVQRLRGLRFATLPVATYLDGPSLAARAAAFTDDYDATDAANDTRLLVALGAAPEGTDLLALFSDALAEQVAGFYDPATGEMVVGGGTDGRRIGILEELTLAHELEHALADATIGLPGPGPDAAPAPEGQDASLASSSLVEGDATLTMEQYALGELTAFQQLRLGMAATAALDGLDALEGLPTYLQRGLLFPYTEGLEFVRGLHAQGGWGAVDAAYADPPTTTAQILFPDRYARREGALQPATPTTPGGGWRELVRYAWGAFDLLAMFEAPGDDTQRALQAPVEAVADWAGGRAVLWDRDGSTAVGLHLVAQGGDGLCASMVLWYQRAFPDGQPVATAADERLAVDGLTQDAVVRCVADQVRVGIGPDLATARAAAA